MRSAIIKRIIKKLFRLNEYDVQRAKATPKVANSLSYKLFEYKQSDGTFDYKKYRSIQEEGNLRKLDRVWVVEKNIEFLSKYLSQLVTPLEFGICHGTRRGNEQSWFRQYLKCDVIGTEISESAYSFPFTIKWDFHDLNPDWLNRADFVYSNSFDHTYAPEQCLKTWISTLRPGGICILEHSNLHDSEYVNQLDSFGASLEIMPYLIAKWGKDQFFLRELLEAPSKNSDVSRLSFLVIQRAK